MNTKSLALIWMIAFSLIAHGRKANADASYLKEGGGAVIPMNNEDIRLVNETIEVDVVRSNLLADDKKLRVKVVYRFRNESDASKTVLMGFPLNDDWLTGYIQSPDGGHWGKVKCSVHNFVVKVDGKKVNYKTKKGKKPVWPTASDALEELADNGRTLPMNNEEDDEESSLPFQKYYIWKVSFKPAQERTVVNKYNYDANASPASNYPNSNRFYYYLDTGSTWKGTIEEATIQVNFHDRACVGGMYEDCAGIILEKDFNEGCKIEGCIDFREDFFTFPKDIPGDVEPWEGQLIISSENTTELVWKFKDLEPTQDIKFSYETATLVRKLILKRIKGLKLKNQLPETLMDAKNTLLALAGMVFQDEELMKCFLKKSWYVAGPAMTEKKLPKGISKLFKKIDNHLKKLKTKN